MISGSFILGLFLAVAVDKELEPLQGTWRVEKIAGRGKEISGEQANAVSFVFEGNTVRRFVKGVDRKDPATIKVDTSKKPIQFDLKPAKEGDPTMLGIFEIEGDTLKWCFGSKKRPEKFESGEGSDAILIIMKRTKK